MQATRHFPNTSNTPNRLTDGGDHPYGTVIEEDEGEKRFKDLVRLWVEDEVDYETLLDEVPKPRRRIYHKTVVERLIELFH